MKVIVNLPEVVIEGLGGLAGTEQALVQRLHALPDYRLGDKIIVLDAHSRVQLEGLLGGPLDTTVDVVRNVARLAAVKIGVIERPLTAGEAERVKAYASSHGITYEVALGQFVEPLLAQFLEGV